MLTVSMPQLVSGMQLQAAQEQERKQYGLTRTPAGAKGLQAAADFSLAPAITGIAGPGAHNGSSSSGTPGHELMY